MTCGRVYTGSSMRPYSVPLDHPRRAAVEIIPMPAPAPAEIDPDVVADVIARGAKPAKRPVPAKRKAVR
jgi:hypothetical protein